MTLRIGCCGFAEAQATYYRHFPLIEVQKTFYQPPRLVTARRWREEAPGDFAFTLKAWQLITHEPSSPTYRRLRTQVPDALRDNYDSFRPTPEVMDAWTASLRIARALAAPVVVFQCPASFRLTDRNRDRMREFFGRIDRNGLALVWEPRGDWEPSVVRAFCRELNLIHGVDPFRAESVTGEPFYFRLHGIGGYHYRYSAKELRELLTMCEGREGYVLFNNDAMLENARRFLELVG